VSELILVTAPPDGDRRDEPKRALRLTQASRDGAMEAWLTILSRRHPDVVWVPLRAKEQDDK
jgi:hypothetical protein